MDPLLLTFLGVAALLTITPGADTMLIIRSSLVGGFGRSVITTFGICAGLLVHAALSALGLSVVVMHSAEVYHAVKLAGAAYLIWLGVQSLREAFRRDRSDDGATDAAFAAMSTPHGREIARGSSARGTGKAFGEGFLSNVLNPKVAIFYLAFLPQFVRPDDPVLARSLFLACIHAAMGIVWLLFVARVLHTARSVVLRPAVSRWLHGVSGTVLMVFGVKLATAER